MKKSGVGTWLRTAQRIFLQCPEGCWLFAADGHLYLMQYGEDGRRRLLQNGSMDAEAIVGKLTGPEIDGGDW